MSKIRLYYWKALRKKEHIYFKKPVMLFYFMNLRLLQLVLIVFLLYGSILLIFIAMIDEWYEKSIIDCDKKLVDIKNGLKIIY